MARNPNISQYICFCHLLHFLMPMITQYWQWLFFYYSFYPSAFPQDRRRSPLAPLISTTWPPPPWSPLPHISAPDSESTAEINIRHDRKPHFYNVFVFLFLPGSIIKQRRHIVTKNYVIYCMSSSSKSQTALLGMCASMVDADILDVAGELALCLTCQ